MTDIDDAIDSITEKIEWFARTTSNESSLEHLVRCAWLHHVVPGVRDFMACPETALDTDLISRFTATHILPLMTIDDPREARKLPGRLMMHTALVCDVLKLDLDLDEIATNREKGRRSTELVEGSQ